MMIKRVLIALIVVTPIFFSFQNCGSRSIPSDDSRMISSVHEDPQPDTVNGLSESWPPHYMASLPGDYLKRIHQTLSSMKKTILTLTCDSPNSIAWVRFGLANLALGENSELVNRCLSSTNFVWLDHPKFGFGLFASSYLRFYGLFRHDSIFFSGIANQSHRMTKEAQARFESEMWRVAKGSSRLLEASENIWMIRGSENHHVAKMFSNYLAAQFLHASPSFRDLTYEDGSSPGQQKQAWRQFVSNWFDERAKKGLLLEAASTVYEPDTIDAIINVRDFSDDPVIQKKATMFLDLIYANLAEETLLSTRGGSKVRQKGEDRYSKAFDDRGYNLLFDSPGRSFEITPKGSLATSNYFPSSAVRNLARDIDERGSYAFHKRALGLGFKSGQQVTLMPDKTTLRNGFASKNFIIGTASVDPTWSGVDAAGGFRWQGIVFRENPLARIGFEVEPQEPCDERCRKSWHSFDPFVSVQDRNIFVTQKWAPVSRNGAVFANAKLRVYFSNALDDVVERDGWIFVKSGSAYAAVGIMGGYTWNNKWQHNAPRKTFATTRVDKPVVVVANDAEDYGNSFSRFQSAILSERPSHENGEFKFATIRFFGVKHPGQINGTPIDLEPRLGFNSPFLKSDFGSGLICIRKDEDFEILDFRDAENPTRSTAADATICPRGRGTDESIVL